MGKSNVAFVLIMCNYKSVECLIKQIDEIDTVTETAAVDGPWRIIAKLESTDLDHIREAIRWKLRKMDGIESTLTLVEYMK